MLCLVRLHLVLPFLNRSVGADSDQEILIIVDEGAAQRHARSPLPHQSLTKVGIEQIRNAVKVPALEEQRVVAFAFVVSCAPVRIDQHLESQRDVQEAALSISVPRVLVWMVEQSLLAVTSLDLSRGGVTLYAEHFVQRHCTASVATRNGT